MFHTLTPALFGCPLLLTLRAHVSAASVAADDFTGRQSSVTDVYNTVWRFIRPYLAADYKAFSARAQIFQYGTGGCRRMSLRSAAG